MITVRKAVPTDAAAACAALRRSIVECCHEDHGGNATVIAGWIANKTPAAVGGWIRSPGYCVVAERDGTVVGTAMLGHDGTVALCYLVPEARNLGAGKAMLQALEAEARKRGHKSLELGSTKTAHDFYMRNGYADTGKVESAFGLTAIMMSKEIGDGKNA